MTAVGFGSGPVSQKKWLRAFKIRLGRMIDSVLRRAKLYGQGAELDSITGVFPVSNCENLLKVAIMTELKRGAEARYRAQLLE